MLVPDEPGNFAIGVIQVTEVPRLCRAGDDAGRRRVPIDTRRQSLLHAAVDPLHTEIALRDSPLFMRVDLLPHLLKLRKTLTGIILFLFSIIGANLIGAGHQTVPAAHALIRIDPDDTILTLTRGTGRTGVHTLCLFAVIAQHGIDPLDGPGVLTAFRNLEPVEEHIRRQKMLLLALDHAAIAANTSDQIYQHAPSHRAVLPSCFLYALTLTVGSAEPDMGQK